MPLYEYECPKCGRFEAIQKMSDKPLKAKPDCKEKGCPRKAQKLISAAGFALKGGGWYKDGYASSGSSSTSSGSSSGSDSKPSEGKTGGDNTPKASKKSCGSGCGCH
jgi:putative FmdB family regulatory protein